MKQFPNPSSLPLHINSLDFEFCPQVSDVQRTPADSATGVANFAVYMPFSIPWAYPIARGFVVNGTVASGNIDFGIYSSSGSKLISIGSTAQAGTSVFQYFPLVYLLPAGSYYFGVGNSSSTAHFFVDKSFSAAQARSTGLLEQTASAFPLPATMAPIAVAASFFILCGITRTSAGF